MKKFLEAGKIVNTHGVRGEVRITPWADSAEFLRRFRVFYIDGQGVKVLRSRVHKTQLIALLEGVDPVAPAAGTASAASSAAAPSATPRTAAGLSQPAAPSSASQTASDPPALPPSAETTRARTALSKPDLEGAE